MDMKGIGSELCLLRRVGKSRIKLHQFESNILRKTKTVRHADRRMKKIYIYKRKIEN